MKIPGRISFIGASTTEGQGDAEQGGFVGRFRAWHQAKSSHNHVFNLGISGNTSADVLERVKVELKPRLTALTVVCVGLNDTRREPNVDSPSKVDLAQFSSNYQQILNIAQESGPVVGVSILPIDDSKTQPVEFGSIYYLLADAQVYAQRTKEIYAELNIPYLNLFDEWLKEDYKQWLSADGLHPNPEGHRRIFERLKEWIETLNASE